METAVENNRMLVRLDDGEDMFASLRSVLKSKGMVNGCVLFGIGQMRDFELGFFDGVRYHRKMFQGPSELVSLQGTISLNVDPPMHLHACLSHDDMSVIGGHLFKATVATINEIFVRGFQSITLGRELDESTGLKKLTLKPGSS